MERSKIIFNKSSILFIIIVIFFFSLYFINITFVQPLKVGSIILFTFGLILFSKKNFNGLLEEPHIINWILTLIPFLFSLFYTIDYTHSLTFVLIYLATIIIFVLVGSSNFDTQVYILKINYFFSVLIMFITLSSYIFPNTFQNLALPFLNEGATRAYYHFLRMGELSGISGQTGTNAFFLSVGVAFLVFKKKNLINTLLLLLFIFMLLMSAKRGIILANIISFLLVNLFFKKISYKYLILWFLTLFIFIGSLGIFIENFNFINLNDLSSGRFVLYKQAVDSFSENVFTGIGVNTFSLIYGFNTHNVYFQLLSEVGIFGFIVYTFAQIGTLKYSISLKHYFTRKSSTHEYSQYFYTIVYFQLFFITYSFVGNALYDYNFFFIYLLFNSLLLKLPRGENSK